MPQVTAGEDWKRRLPTPQWVLTAPLTAASHPIKIPGSTLRESLFLKKNSIFTGKSQNKLLPSPVVRSKWHQEHFFSSGIAARGARVQGDEERRKFRKYTWHPQTWLDPCPAPSLSPCERGQVILPSRPSVSSSAKSRLGENYVTLELVCF